MLGMIRSEGLGGSAVVRSALWMCIPLVTHPPHLQRSGEISAISSLRVWREQRPPQGDFCLLGTRPAERSPLSPLTCLFI